MTIPVPPGPALPPESTWTTEWTSHRMPDAVRAAALANAVDLVKELHPIILTQETLSEDLAQAAGIALAIAAEFEAYLTGGQEADGEG